MHIHMIKKIGQCQLGDWSKIWQLPKSITLVTYLSEKRKPEGNRQSANMDVIKKDKLKIFSTDSG